MSIRQNYFFAVINTLVVIYTHVLITDHRFQMHNFKWYLPQKSSPKTRPMSDLCCAFLDKFRKEKTPPALNNDNPYKKIYLSLRQNKRKPNIKVVPEQSNTR